MAIKIKGANSGIVNSNPPHIQEVEILADTEADITSLGEVVTAGDVSVVPAAGSIAFTADLSAVYIKAPSGAWTKM